MTINKLNDYLYVGDSRAYLDLEEPSMIMDLQGWRFDLNFGKSNLINRNEVEMLVSTGTILLMTRTPLLVKCHGGIDRSPFISTLILQNAVPPYRDHIDVYNEVKRLHPQTLIHDDWLSWWLLK